MDFKELFRSIVMHCIDIVRLFQVSFVILHDEEADYYNERIRHFESGDYSGTRKVDLNAIRK